MTIEALEKIILNADGGLKANLVPDLNDEQITKIANEVVQGFEDDLNSMEGWLDEANEIMELLKLKGDVKNFPFDNSSNVKLPIITLACMQFASRTAPEIIKNNRAVKYSTVGFDDAEGTKTRKGQRIEMFLNYKLLVESQTWQEELDRLLMEAPAIGTVFTKSYFDVISGQVRTHLVPYNKLIVNNNIKSLDLAPRISELVELSTNDIISGIRQGYYTDIDVKLLEDPNERGWEKMPEFIEQQCLLDLDEDGYAEPYTVIVHKETRHVLRVRPNFYPEEIEVNDEGEIIRIAKRNFYTDYHFIPSADGTFFSLGFGTLLFNTNKAINSVLNQLIDSGTLANTQGGFVASHLRINKGTKKFKHGEWKPVNSAMNSRLQDSFYPLTYKEPSGTLFQLLTYLVDSSKELTSTTEALTGNMDGQNTSPATLMALIKEGMRVFTATQKRLNRGLQKNYQLLYELHSAYTTPEEYFNILDVPEDYHRELINEQGNLVDFDLSSKDFTPVSDFTASSEALKLVQSRALKEIAAMNPDLINRQEVVLFDLEALEINDPARFLLEEPQPNPEGLAKQAELQMSQMKLQLEAQKLQIDLMKANSQAIKDETQAIKNMAEAEAVEPGQQLQAYKIETDLIKEGMKQNGATGQTQSNSDSGMAQ